MKTIYVIHSSNVTLELLNGLFKKNIPEARVYNIIDDSLLAGLFVHGSPTKDMAKRFCAYASLAEGAGADIIFSQCSSYGNVVDVARKLVDIPIIKIDGAMMELAVKSASRIAVLATVKSTMGPSCDLLRECAGIAGKRIEITEIVAENALSVLMDEKDPDKHDKIVMDLIDNLPKEVECAVLAQGSMHRLKDKLANAKIPVLVSPESGVLAVREALGL